MAALPSKEILTDRLAELIQRFVTNGRCTFEGIVVPSTLPLPADQAARRLEISERLSRVRDAFEGYAKREIADCCAALSKAEIDELQALLDKAGIYWFRKNLEIDLYIGFHTAISAYCKMIASVLFYDRRKASLAERCEDSFSVLRFVATTPLPMLVALDGIFWDMGELFIPDCFVTDDDGRISIYEQRLVHRIARISYTEKRSGCPALRVRTAADSLYFNVIERAIIAILR